MKEKMSSLYHPPTAEVSQGSWSDSSMTHRGELDENETFRKGIAFEEGGERLRRGSQRGNGVCEGVSELWHVFRIEARVWDPRGLGAASRPLHSHLGVFLSAAFRIAGVVAYSIPIAAVIINHRSRCALIREGPLPMPLRDPL